MRTQFHPLRILFIGLSLTLLIGQSFDLLPIWPFPLSSSNQTPILKAAQPDTLQQITGSLAGSIPDGIIPDKTDYNKDDEPKNKLIGSPSWQLWLDLPIPTKAKVDPRLIAELSGQIRPAHRGGTSESHQTAPSDQQALDHTRFIVYMDAQIDLTHELSQRVFASTAQQRSATLNILSAHAQSSQAALSSTLNERMNSSDVLGYHSFFIVNAMAVEGNLDTIIALAHRPDVARIQANYPLTQLWDSGQGASQPTALNSPGGSPNSSLNNSLGSSGDANAAQDRPDALDSTHAVETLNPDNWNIDLVNADSVWTSLGVRGEGAVVAGFDTGVEYTHPALEANYRGKVGEDVYDHNYSWFAPDPNLYPNGNLGPSLSDEPSDCDYYGTHGTHTMGTMVGRNNANGSGRATDIGMAPNARWIAVPGICAGTMPGNLSDDIGGLKAFQWLLCPTDLSGDLSTADCSKAPDVVNNSWGSANPVNDILHPAIEALRAAGIAPVFAAGNPSAGEGSIGTPGNSPAAITVGATDIDDDIASFSARGPSFYTGEQKPELTAPGVDVRSSVGASDYYAYSGTSMAAPHVAGLVALMVSADLEDGVRDFDVDDIERFMTYTAVDLGPKGFDEDYGFGRIDALAAVSWVMSAGDLRGTITDATTNVAISNATVTGRTNDQSFSIQSSATGVYSITAPAGQYTIEVNAWGYESKIFSSQTVYPSSLSFADFKLEPEPTALVQGTITTGAAWGDSSSTGPPSGSPVANAQLMIVDGAGANADETNTEPTNTEQTSASSGIIFTTDASGAYSMTLPSGNHHFRITAAGHRTITATIDISATDSAPPIALDLAMDGAPEILLIDADASGGWFTGWPVYPIFEDALDRVGYPYELWRIQHLDVTDLGDPNADGSEKRGIPSLETLQQYDVVIWLHSGCGDYYCFVGGSPQGIDAEDLLISYLDGGGRLILSGQNISAWTNRSSPLMDYLGSEHVSSFGGTDGELLMGSDYLEDLSIKITNASLYGYRNGILNLSPDSVKPKKDNAIAQPILHYTDGNAAALAVSPCNSSYRSVFFPVGYENLGPRADNRAVDALEAMNRSIQWLSEQKQDYALSFTANTLSQSQAQGKTISYELDVANSGLQPLTVQFNLSGDNWETVIYSGTVSTDVSPDSDDNLPLQPLTPGESVLIQPCQANVFTVEVEVPASAENGEKDVALIEAV